MKARKLGLTSALVSLFPLLATEPLAAADISFRMNESTSEKYSKLCDFQIVGTLEAGDDEVFRKTVIAALASDCLYPRSVALYSPGGNLAAAMAIGQQVAVLGLSTSAPHYVRAPPLEAQERRRNCKLQTRIGERRIDDGDCVCASACVFIWLAGSKRLGDIVGVHRPIFASEAYSQLSPYEARHRFHELMTTARSYLRDIGTPEALIEKMASTSSDTVSFLSVSELALFRTAPFFQELETSKCGGPEEVVRARVSAELRRRGDPPASGGDRTNDYLREILVAMQPYYKCAQAMVFDVASQGRATYLARYNRPGRPP